MQKKSKNTESLPDQASKQNMFDVPENYFQDLPGRILEAVETKIHGKDKSAGAWDRFKPAFLIAASVLGFMIISYTGLKLLRAEKESDFISSLDAIEYVGFYSHEFEEDLLLENIDMDETGTVLVLNETDEIIEYLIQEGIDDLTLYNEL